LKIESCFHPGFPPITHSSPLKYTMSQKEKEGGGEMGAPKDYKEEGV
jgi:hypothetical protein